jgi:hypothetical protein
MSERTLKNYLAILGAITAASTIAVQLIGIGELKGEFRTNQQVFTRQIEDMKTEIGSIKLNESESRSRIADLNARVINIEKKL